MSKLASPLANIHARVDLLLNQVAQGTEFHFQSGLCGDWTLMANKPTKAALHLVTEGHCWFGLSPQQPSVLELNAGDIIFVNQGVSHFLSHSPVPNDIAEHELASFCEPEHQQDGVVCYDIDSPSQITDIVFRLLPPWLVLSHERQAHEMKAIIDMIRAEAKRNEPGGSAIVQRLSDVLAIHLLRAVIGGHQELTGPLAALQDKYLRDLVFTIIEHPAADWSVESMAKQVFLSPSAFAERCHKQTGLSPKKLVDQLRMQRARMLLNNTALPLTAIAQQVGYQSVAAFSRFFKRYAGIAASDYRETSR